VEALVAVAVASERRRWGLVAAVGVAASERRRWGLGLLTWAFCAAGLRGRGSSVCGVVCMAGVRVFAAWPAWQGYEAARVFVSAFPNGFVGASKAARVFGSTFPVRLCGPSEAARVIGSAFPGRR
jgi:hypothetical protein